MSTKYSWSSSALSSEEMKALYLQKQITHKPINLSIKEAVQEYTRKLIA